jgi:hypothetical protein
LEGGVRGDKPGYAGSIVHTSALEAPGGTDHCLGTNSSRATTLTWDSEDLGNYKWKVALKVYFKDNKIETRLGIQPSVEHLPSMYKGLGKISCKKKKRKRKSVRCF